jgi:pyruvyl transferase EpsO
MAPVMAGAIAAQQQALRALYRRHVAPGQSYVLLDFPDHANVGDSAIWLGELAMLREVTGRDPDHVATWDAFDAAALRRDCPGGVVFLHGGGNLGDIWPHHQRFREAVLRDVRDVPVVQLPQSIYYRDPAQAAPFVAAVAAHPDFHLHVRDRASLDWASAHLACPVTLAPDSAFALGPQARRGAADCDLLMLLRTDDERVAGIAPERAEAVVVDWLADDPLPAALPGETRAAAFERMATVRVERGLRLLSRGRRIVTDRLHGHILATLLGIPHTALDNEYGKLSAYIRCWTAGCAGVDTA